MASDSLHQLIHSLSKNEKIYFVKNLSKTDTSCKLLFKSINAQRDYDEKALKKRFKGQYIGNNFAFNKNYLHNAILRSCIRYRNNQKGGQYEFAVIEFLYERSLYHDCVKKLLHLYDRVSVRRDHLSILRVIDLARSLLQNTTISSDRLHAIVGQEQEVISELAVISQFKSLLLTIKEEGSKTGFMKEGYDQVRVDLVKKDVLLQKEPEEGEIIQRIYFQEIHYLIGLLGRDIEKCKVHARKLSGMIERKEVLLVIGEEKHVSLLERLIGFNAQFDSMTTAMEQITSFTELLDGSPAMGQAKNAEHYFQLFNYKLHILYKQGNMDGLTKVVAELRPFIEKNARLVPQESIMVLSVNIIRFMFILKDYKQLLVLTNEFWVQHRKGIRKDILINAMLFELVVLMDLNKRELVESRVKALRYFLSRYEIIDERWDLFYTFFTRILEGEKVKREAAVLLKGLERLPKEEINTLGLLVDWARSKL